MKKKIRDLIYSFLALFLLSCAFAAAILLGMLLIPVFIVIIGVIAVKEIVLWRRKKKEAKSNRAVTLTYQKTAVVRTMPENGPYRKVA